jgi:hypothetical protein
MFHEAWGKEAPQLQAEFNDYLQVFNAHGSSRTTRLFTSVFSFFCVCLFSQDLLVLDTLGTYKHIVMTQNLSPKENTILHFIFHSFYFIQYSS